MNNQNAHLYLPLVQALAEGKTIQHLDGYGIWNDTAKPIFSKSPDEYRIKPWTLTRHLPGFRPLRDGEEWGGRNWSADDLLNGTRPFLVGERYSEGDGEVLLSSGWAALNHCGTISREQDCRVRTRRPLPEPPKPVPWNDTSDFPKVPTIWIRSKGDYREHKVVGFAHPCAIITVTCGSQPALMSIHLTQDGFEDMEWSENREVWTPCSKLP